ncbi:hypothetical protein HDU67_003363 [Dinochytrium kinnereticum]|nr:hypothetical protein HDU67_003363 [Dinochytrium kinnereticum]
MLDLRTLAILAGSLQFVSAQLISSTTMSSNMQCGTSSSSAAVHISHSSSALTIQFSGCPGYDWTSQSTPNKATVQCGSFSVPISPTINQNIFHVGVFKDKAKTIANTNIPMGQIGVTVTGVALYGNADATKEDAYVNEAKTFDRCGGHPDARGIYHFHDEPADKCVYTSTAGAHSPLFGVMLDGIPIFGSLGDGGVAPADLDECNGHTDKAYPFYREFSFSVNFPKHPSLNPTAPTFLDYHMAPDGQYPYLVNCLKGCVSSTTTSRNSAANMAPTCIKATTQYDYTSLYKTLLPATSSLITYSCDVTTGASIQAATTSSTGSGSIDPNVAMGSGTTGIIGGSGATSGGASIIPGSVVQVPGSTSTTAGSVGGVINTIGGLIGSAVSTVGNIVGEVTGTLGVTGATGSGAQAVAAIGTASTGQTGNNVITIPKSVGLRNVESFQSAAIILVFTGVALSVFC